MNRLRSHAYGMSLIAGTTSGSGTALGQLTQLQVFRGKGAHRVGCRPWARRQRGAETAIPASICSCVFSVSRFQSARLGSDRLLLLSSRNAATKT